jgi:hypothetical protein
MTIAARGIGRKPHRTITSLTISICRSESPNRPYGSRLVVRSSRLRIRLIRLGRTGTLDSHRHEPNWRSLRGLVSPNIVAPSCRLSSASARISLDLFDIRELVDRAPVRERNNEQPRPFHANEQRLSQSFDRLSDAILRCNVPAYRCAGSVAIRLSTSDQPIRTGSWVSANGDGTGVANPMEASSNRSFVIMSAQLPVSLKAKRILTARDRLIEE